MGVVEAGKWEVSEEGSVQVKQGFPSVPEGPSRFDLV
jgi:hypothetical protein